MRGEKFTEGSRMRPIPNSRPQPTRTMTVMRCSAAPESTRPSHADRRISRTGRRPARSPTVTRTSSLTRRRIADSALVTLRYLERDGRSDLPVTGGIGPAGQTGSGGLGYGVGDEVEGTTAESLGEGAGVAGMDDTALTSRSWA